MAEKFSAVCAKAVKEAIADTLNEETILIRICLIFIKNKFLLNKYEKR